MTNSRIMDKQYSVQFFTSFVESLQDVCRSYLSYNQFVEVSGYVCVEIDNMKKERYVLSELLQSSGNVVSESYCTKACLTQARTKPLQQFHSRPRSLVARTHSERNQINRHQPVQRSSPGYTVSGVQYRRTSEKTPSRAGVQFSKDDFRLPNQQNSVPTYKQNVKETSESNKLFGGLTHPQASWQDSWSKGSPIQSPFSSGSDNSVDCVPSTKVVKGESEGSEVNVIVPPCMVNTSGLTVSSVRTDSHGSDGLQDMTDQSGSLTVSSCYSLKETEQDSDTVAMESAVLDNDVIDLDLIDDEEVDDGMVMSAPMEQDVSQDVLQTGFANMQQMTKFSPDINHKGQTLLSPGSKHVMKSAIKQFQRYHFEKSGQDIDVLATPPEQLNDLLLEFYQNGRTLNGKELTPGSLKNVQIYLDKYLRDGGYPYSISKDDHFLSSRGFIKAKVNEGSRQVVPQRYVPVNDHDIEALFQSSQLGSGHPDSLINTMWILNSRLFAVRGPTEHFNLKWGEITLTTDADGQEYLERPSNAHKTCSLKVFANLQNPERCFVRFYKMYQAVRPKLMLDPSSAFYLKSIRTPVQDTWYLPEALSWSSLTNLWKRMVVGAGLPLNKKIF